MRTAAEMRAAWRRYREAHREEIRAYNASWHAKNKADRNRKKREVYAAERRSAKKILSELPCFDCGMSHDDATRERIIRRMLPASAWEIRESWPCFWGPADEQKSPGERRLYRDLARLGAVREAGVYALREGRAA